jgi:hypothetical protein
VARLEGADVRYRFGVNPTASEGMLLSVGDILTISAHVDASSIRFVRATDTDGVLKVTCWRVPAQVRVHRATPLSSGVEGGESANTPTADEKAALAGTSGSPSTTNRYVTTLDTRMSDARVALAHSHDQADVVGLTLALAGKAALDHLHDKADITDFTHAHVLADVTGLSAALDGKADVGHTHVRADITNFAHTHVIADTTGLQAALDARSPLASTCDPTTEKLRWTGTVWECITDQTSGGGGGAPTDATYITQTANAGLSAEQALAALTTGILKVTTTTGVLSTAVAGDFPTLNQSTTGNAATSTALAANPTDCGANVFATSIDAAGNLTCGAITDAAVPNTITVDAATTATTAGAFVSNPTDCAAGEFANAIAANGNLTCAEPAGGGGASTLTKLTGNSAGPAGLDETWQVLTANNSAVTSTTLATAFTTTGLTGSSIYDIEYDVVYSTAAGTTGANFSLNFTGTVTELTARRIIGTTAASTTAHTGTSDMLAATLAGQGVEHYSTRSNNGSMGPNAGVDTANAVVVERIYATLITGASGGDLQLRIATEVNASGVTLRAGTRVVIRRLNP